MPNRLELLTLAGIPLVEAGDDLAAIILAALESSNQTLRDGDVLVVAQKIVSKAEGAIVELDTVEPSEQARELATQVDKDPRLVELILRESRAVVRAVPGVLIVEHRSGLILANAGIDQSNVEHGVAPESAPSHRPTLPTETLPKGAVALLLPEDADRSARRLRHTLAERTGARVAVVINDSLGRAWRTGTVGIAIGVSGLVPVVDLRGNEDLFGRVLRVSEEALADEVAAAASLLQGQGAEGRPVVLVRGLAQYSTDDDALDARCIVRPPEQDLFR